jgi:hypothetical protein
MKQHPEPSCTKPTVALKVFMQSTFGGKKVRFVCDDAHSTFQLSTEADQQHIPRIRSSQTMSERRDRDPLMTRRRSDEDFLSQRWLNGSRFAADRSSLPRNPRAPRAPPSGLLGLDSPINTPKRRTSVEATNDILSDSIRSILCDDLDEFQTRRHSMDLGSSSIVSLITPRRRAPPMTDFNAHSPVKSLVSTTSSTPEEVVITLNIGRARAA